MRDIGAVVWVILVVVGVVSSIVSNARRQAAASHSPQTQGRQPQPAPTAVLRPRAGVAPRQGAPQYQPQSARAAVSAAPAAPAAPVAPAASVVPVAPRAKVVRQPKAPEPEALHVAELRPQRRLGRAIFTDRKSIVRGIVAAEILGKPLALRDGP